MQALRVRLLRPHALRRQAGSGLPELSSSASAKHVHTGPPCSPSSSPPPLVLYEQRGRVGVITLNAPDRLNALSVEMGAALAQVLDRVDTRTTHALITRGAGKAFSAGGDLAFLRARAADTGSRNAVLMKRFYDLFLGAIRAVPLPTIAAINGAAVGAGLAFAMGHDLRLSTTSARMGVIFTAIGLHPGMGTTHLLPRLVGPQVAARMALTGELIDGRAAAACGLVLEAVEGEDALMRTAMELAEKIAGNGPVAVRSCVRTLRMESEGELQRALMREADAQAYCYSGPDLVEGVEAVAGKRKPSYTQAEGYGW